MEDILSEIKKGEVTRVEFNNAQLHKFFPYNYSPAMMKREILAILKIYKEQYSEKQEVCIMCKVISIVNQKGGCSKTTSAVNIGIGLANAGKKVVRQ